MCGGSVGGEKGEEEDSECETGGRGDSVDSPVGYEKEKASVARTKPKAAELQPMRS